MQIIKLPLSFGRWFLCRDVLEKKPFEVPRGYSSLEVMTTSHKIHSTLHNWTWYIAFFSQTRTPQGLLIQSSPFIFPKKKLRPYPWSIHGATRLAKVGHIFGKVEGKVVGWSGSLGWLVTMKKQSNQVDLLNKVWSQLEQIWSGCYSPGVRVARVATKGAFWAHPRDLTCDWQPGPRPTWSSPLDGWCQNISKCRWKWSSREETRGTSVFRYSSRLIFQPFVAVQSAVVHSLVFPA